MKNKIRLILVLGLLLTVPAMTLATGSASSGYNEPIPESALRFEAVSDGNHVNTSWVKYAPEGFNYYKVVRSVTNPDPVYPDDGYIQVIENADTTSYVDYNVPEGVSYYRVCSIVNPNRYCSNVVMIEKSEGIPVEKTVSEKVIATDEYQALRDEITALKAKVARLEAFVDTQRHRYEAAINYLREQGIVQGYDDGSYKPDNTINRAEFMKIVMGEKYGNELTAEEAGCFNDVGKEWYAPYVCLGKNKGVVSGYDNGNFGPGNQISFVEAAKILANVYELELGSEGSHWYEKYVLALQSEGYIPSSVDELAKPITRAEMAELIWRIKEQIKDQAHAKLISESVQLNEGDFKGWVLYNGSDFRFYHPGWYQGTKWNRTLLTDELDFYQNLNTPNYLDVDSYMTVYDIAGTNLNTDIWTDHPFVSSAEMTINGIRALKRHFRAPRGTVVNGRTTGENENITVYSYEVNGRTVVLEYFNAYGMENENVEVFDKIASSFSLK